MCTTVICARFEHPLSSGGKSFVPAKIVTVSVLYTFCRDHNTSTTTVAIAQPLSLRDRKSTTTVAIASPQPLSPSQDHCHFAIAITTTLLHHDHTTTVLHHEAHCNHTGRHIPHFPFHSDLPASSSRVSSSCRNTMRCIPIFLALLYIERGCSFQNVVPPKSRVHDMPSMNHHQQPLVPFAEPRSECSL